MMPLIYKGVRKSLENSKNKTASLTEIVVVPLVHRQKKIIAYWFTKECVNHWNRNKNKTVSLTKIVVVRLSLHGIFAGAAWYIYISMPKFVACRIFRKKIKMSIL